MHACMQIHLTEDSCRKMESEIDKQQLELMSIISDDLEGDKLIDLAKEDDDLLSHSPLFDSLQDQDLRLSVTFDNIIKHEDLKVSENQPYQEVENTVDKLLQKEQGLSSYHDLVPARPSYMRKSLAWDDAFFTSPGVLDSDELTFINKGFETAEMRLPPDTFQRDAFHPASRNINIGIQNKIKTSASEGRKNNQKSVKNNTKGISKGEEFHSLPFKAPKILSRIKNVLMGHGKSASVDYHAELENKTATFRSGNNLKLSKKSDLMHSCSFSSGSLAFSEYASVIAGSANDTTVTSSLHDRKASASSTKVASGLLKRKSESRKSTLSGSKSTPDAAVRYLVKGQGLTNPRFSTQSLSLPNHFSYTSSSSPSKGSSSGSRSGARQQCTKVQLDTPAILRTGSQDEEDQSPYVMNNLHRKSTLCMQTEETNSPVQLSKQGLTDTYHVPTESRKKLKPSCLRMPSPKIGFFDEEISTTPMLERSFQLQIEMQCTSPSNYGSSDRKTPDNLLQFRTSSETRCMKQGSRSTQLLSPACEIKPRHVTSERKVKCSSPTVWNTMKSGADIGLRFHSGMCGQIEEKICSKCRKVGAARECDRKKFGQSSILRRDDERRRVKGRLNNGLSREAKGQRTDPNIRAETSTPIKKENGCNQEDANNSHSPVEDKARTLANSEDQVNDLSRYFEVIDLSTGMATENKADEKDCPLSQVDNIISKLNSDNVFVAHDQKQDVLPNTFPDSGLPSPPGAEFSPSSRTPLADKTSISNTSGSLIQSTTKEKLADKPSKVFPCPESPPYKENILALYKL